MSQSLLHGKKAEEARLWLSKSQELASMLSGLLGVMHPDLYTMARSAMINMMTTHEDKKLLDNWGSVYNSCQIIKNRETPVHRDNNSDPRWLDMLLTIGPYTHADMELPGLGYRLSYEPGTIVALSGQMVRHGVNAVDGERVCCTYYMIKKVQNNLGSADADWSTMGKIRDMIDSM